MLNLTIEAYVSNSLVASKPLTFTDVEDGAQGPQGPQGDQGPQGPKGDKGEDGIAGKDGVGLKSTVVTYGLSTSETVKPITWYAQVPTLTKGNYLWTKTVWTYTDNTSETGYQKTYIGKDGNDGNDGLPGKDGVGIVSTVITYAGSTSGTTKPTSGWTSTIPSVPDGQYLWTKTVWTYTDETTETGYSVAKMGEKGEDGRSEVRREPFYKLTNTADVPTSPSGNRNLFKNSRDFSGTGWINNDNGVYAEDYQGVKIFKTNTAWLGRSQYFEVKTGEEYVFSAYVKSSAKTDGVHFYLAHESKQPMATGLVSSGSVSGQDSIYFELTDEYQRIAIKIKITKDGWIAPRLERGNTNAYLFFGGYKFEKGKTATPYNQSPEDLDWSETTLVPTQSQRYLWKFEYVYYSDGYVGLTQPGNMSVAGPQGIQGIQGPKGDQGIPGEPGADGRTQYTHIAYADNATGGGFSQTDQNKAYIGMYVDFTATDSNDPTKYKWSKWHGEDGAQGIPGKPGADGKTPYIHFAYADDDKGTNFSLTDKNQQYQGYYSDYTEADSTDYRKYKWVDRLANVQVSTKNLILKSNDFSNPHKQAGNNTEVTSTNGYFVIKSTGYTANAWGGMSWNMSISEVKAGEQFSILMPVYIDSSISLDDGLAFTIKNHSSNSEAYSYDVPTNKKDQWFNVAITFKAVKDAVFDTYPFFVYIVKNGLVRIKPPTLVHGNAVPIDHTSAPEDVQDQIDDKADETITQDQLNALKEQAELQQKELEAKADLDTVEKWYKEYLNYVNINNENKEKSEAALIAISERVAAITNDLGETKERWNFIDTYMDVADEGLVIGKQDGSANIKISNDRISMFSNGDEVMWISQNMLHIANGVFVQTLQIGNFRFESLDSNGEILGLRYLGG